MHTLSDSTREGCNEQSVPTKPDLRVLTPPAAGVTLVKSFTLVSGPNP